MMPRKMTLVHAMISFVIVIVSYAPAAAADDAAEARKHFSFAVQNKQAGNTGEALVQYEKSLALCDTLYQVHYSYADLLLEVGRDDEALAEFTRSLELNGGHYNSALMLAKLHYGREEYGKTLDMYRRLYSLKPDNTKLLGAIAGLQEYLGMHDEALESYAAFADTGEPSVKQLLSAARLAVKKNDRDAALGFAEMILARDGEHPAALRIAADVSRAGGDAAGAGNYLRRLAGVEPENVDILVRLEKLYRDQPDRRGLEWALTRHHALEPANADVLGELSELLYSEGRMDEAMEYVNKGLDAAPDDGRFHLLLGEYYRTDGEEGKALEHYRVALNDEDWKASAQRMIWQIDRPETEEEKMEREFFTRGK